MGNEAAIPSAGEAGPEFALLLAASRWPRQPLGPEARGADLDWDLFAALVKRHRVDGLVAAFLSDEAACAGLAPPPAMQAWARERTRLSPLFEMEQLAALGAILGELRGAGIDPVVLKGLHISQRLYGALGLRNNHDVDLLVPPADYDRAAACLTAAEFVRVIPPESTPAPEFARWRHRRKDASFQHKSGGTLVEVHWRLFDNRHLLPEGALGPPVRERLFGSVEARVLAPAANLVYLAAHGGYHGWSRLKWMADFAGLARQGGASLRAEAEALAARAHALPALTAAYELADRLYGRGERAPLGRLAALGLATLTRGGAQEIEDQKGGARSRNLGHYYLSARPAYRLAELGYDARKYLLRGGVSED